MVHCPFAATLVPQVFVCEKELASVPAMLIPSPLPLSASAAVPVFFSVIAFVAAVVPFLVVGKLRLVGDRLTTGAVPVPASDTVCGDPVALSTMLT